MKTTVQAHIDKCFRHGDLESARRVLETELSKSPNDAWILTRISTTYYEQKDYVRALQFAEKALNADSGSPQVRWDYAGVLDMMGREREAIDIWKSLISDGVNELSENSGHGQRWAESLINDCRFRIGSSYRDIGEKEEAIQYLKKYLFHSSRVIPTIYGEQQARELLRLIGSS